MTTNPLTQDEKDAPLTMSFNGDAWDYFYDILNDWTGKELAVILNGEKVRLVRIEGDILDNDAVLIVNNDLLSEAGKPVVERRIPLFNGAECAVTRLHLL